MLKSFDYIIFWFLAKQIFFNFLAISLLMGLIVFGNQFFLVLSESLNQGLYSSELLPLMFLKLLRDMPFIISFGFSLSIVYSLNNLYKSSEATIIFSGGISEIKLFRLLLPLIILIFSIISILSIFIVPQIKLDIIELKNDAESRPEYIFLREKTFQNFQEEGLTFYSSKITNLNGDIEQDLHKVVIYSDSDDKLITAPKGKKKTINNDSTIELYDGYIYENLSSDDQNVKVTKFSNYKSNLTKNYKTNKVAISADAKSITNLINTGGKKDFAELQYRIGLPLSLLVISMAAIFFSKTNARGKRNFAIGYVVLSYLGYYNLMLIAKTTIEEGEGSYYSHVTRLIINSIYPHLFFILLIYIIYLYRNKLSN